MQRPQLAQLWTSEVLSRQSVQAVSAGSIDACMSWQGKPAIDKLLSCCICMPDFICKSIAHAELIKSGSQNIRKMEIRFFMVDKVTLVFQICISMIDWAIGAYIFSFVQCYSINAIC